MLVLTTMFINVSNNLPKTSYVKMIDIWLIFNLLLPFIEVLVHTYMDTLRWTALKSWTQTSFLTEWRWLGYKLFWRFFREEATWPKSWTENNLFEGMTMSVRSTIMVGQLRWQEIRVQGRAVPCRRFIADWNLKFDFNQMKKDFHPWYWQVASFSEKDLVAVNEQVQMKALKSFYERWNLSFFSCVHIKGLKSFYER